MMSHDACTSETSRVLTVASLQRLKMEALIPAPVDCEVRSVIKFWRTSGAGFLVSVLSCWTITLGHTRLDGQHISCRSSAGMCLIIIHPIARTSRPVISIFLNNPWPRRAKIDWSDCCQMAVQRTLWLAKRLFLNHNSSFLNRISLLLISSCYSNFSHEAGWTPFRTLHIQKNF